jgi:hypothetical protein
MDTLSYYASMSETIVEFGGRKIVSTWAFVMGKPKKLVCVDVVHPDAYLGDGGHTFSLLEDACREDGIVFSFVLGDTLNINIEYTDLLFIDTLHTRAQLFGELTKHHTKVKKWIILHDTETYKDYITVSSGAIEGGLQYAIDDFLEKNKDWKIIERYTNNNGLTILERENLKNE